MNQPTTLYEQASYDLNLFRERRVADRRFQSRHTQDRRMQLAGHQAAAQPKHHPDSKGQAERVVVSSVLRTIM